MTTVRLALPTDDRFVPPDRDLRISWRIEADPVAQQSEYEVQVASTADFHEILHRRQLESSIQTDVIPGSCFGARDERFIRARVRLGRAWSEWSAHVVVEAALGQRDWVAEGISLADDPGTREQAPAPMLRRTFLVDGDVTRARLYVTSLGVNRMFINGKAVSDELLSPGWTTYHKRLLAAAYDVTDLLVHGENVVAGLLGDGWYRGRLGWDPVDTRGRYGRNLALFAQLEGRKADGSTFLVHTDGDWRAAIGQVRRADLYDGCLIDRREAHIGWSAPGFDDSDWESVAKVSVDTGVIEHRTSEPVREIQSWEVEAVESSGAALLDGGQNISGFVRLRMRGHEGDEVVVRHAEVLNPDGSLHTHSLRSAEATDRYVLAESGECLLEPEFTFHGFRYASVESSASLISAEFVAISSDLAPRGRFECSNDGVNRLHENVVWSLRDNFVAIPTDCPQRDERLGWTGDAQAFSATSATLVQSLQFWKSWLTDLALDQHPELGAPAVVPDIVLDEPMRFGRAGWADAATIVPWSLYESYGDLDVLSEQFPSMQAWVDSLERRADPDGLLPESPQFGDWLDPDAPGDKPWMAKVDSTFVANAFYAHSASLVSRSAAVLGRTDLAERYGELADAVGQSTWHRWRQHAVTSQSGCSIALAFALVPPAERQTVAQALGDLVRQANGRVSTGFLGTPLVLHALASEGKYEEAYMMLLCREMPSWLYQVDQGATTTWERWDAIQTDGSIHPGDMSPPPGATDGGHMLSFNHYAYGAVIDWVYRHLGGIAPDPDDPGYRTVVIRPRPPASIDRAKTSVETSFGKVEVAWRVVDGAFEATVSLPFGCRGRLDAPVTGKSQVTVDGEACDAVSELGPGVHRIRITQPSLIDR